VAHVTLEPFEERSEVGARGQREILGTDRAGGNSEVGKLAGGCAGCIDLDGNVLHGNVHLLALLGVVVLDTKQA
jgi:hypothetical protein